MTTRVPDKTTTPTPRRTMSLRRRIAFASMACGMASAGIVIVGEVALRLRASDWSLDYLGPAVGAIPAGGVGPAHFDSRLGYVPAPGVHEWGSWESTVLNTGYRSNGPNGLDGPARILAVGDSFTFGDEVADHDTWPARLEQELGWPVANAGVFGYGLDQAVLRAEAIVARDVGHLEAVVIAFVSDDVARCELSCRHAFKPWFSVEGESLVLHHDPVPASTPQLPSLHSIAGRSHVVRAIARRIAPEWWYQDSVWREHRDGEVVALELLRRLDRTCKAKGVAFVVVGLCGPSGDRNRLASVIRQCEASGLTVLDLSIELGERPRQDFRPQGHLAPSSNALVASRIATSPHLHRAILASSLERPTSNP